MLRVCVQRHAARFTCRDCRSTSSVSSATLQKLNCDTLQQQHARSRVLMLYRICHDQIAVPAAVVYLQPVPTCTRGSQTKYMQIQCSQSFFPHTVNGRVATGEGRLASHFIRPCPQWCQLSTDSFKARLSAIQLQMVPLMHCHHITIGLNLAIQVQNNIQNLGSLPT